MNAKHTATPWRAECWTSHAPRTVLVDDPQALTGKRIVAECESEEDAAFIVRACNAHDDLVTMLKAANNKLQAMHMYHSGPTAAQAIPGLCEKIDAALTKATGGPA